MNNFIARYPLWSLIFILLAAAFLCLVLAPAGFTLIFGLMRIVNLAHGSLFLIGGYVGYEVATASGSWLLAFPIVFIVVGLIGLLMQFFIFSKMEGEELRQTLVSIGLSIVFADLMLWWWAAQSSATSTSAR